MENWGAPVSQYHTYTLDRAPRLLHGEMQMNELIVNRVWGLRLVGWLAVLPTRGGVLVALMITTSPLPQPIFKLH